MIFFKVILCFTLGALFVLCTKANDRLVVYHITSYSNSTQSHTQKGNDIFQEITLTPSANSIYKQREVAIFNKQHTQDVMERNDNATLPNEEGAFCRRSFDGRSGYCVLAYHCLHILRELRIHGTKIDICTYRKNIPVICCSLEDKHIVEHRISAEKCQQYHGALKVERLSNPPVLSGRQCVSSVPMIVGGEKTQAGAYPHMAILGCTESDGQIKWICGGTLISEQFVLTAAHCATSNSMPPDIVRLGALRLNETTSFLRDIKILIIILHPKYITSEYYNDIALLQLTKRVQFSELIRPACLWQQSNIPTDTVIATGWGRMDFLGSTSNDLLKVELNLVDQDSCKHFYRNKRPLLRGITETQFCAGHSKGGKDTCQGDSGGPVHIELPEYNCVKFVVGITSFGKFCGAPNVPGVYTKIYIYLDWIEKIVFRH